MKKEKSLSLNSFMNTFKTFMGLVFPLITYPYALRVLGVDNIGKNNYANSIVSYFILLAGLGISRYAIREGARKRENRKEFSRFAGQMLAINIVSVTVAYVALFILLMLVPSLNSYAKLIILHSVTIFGTMIGMDWVNSAYEEYVYITLRTIAFQIISMLLLFVLVRDENDLMKYAFISVLSNIGANILNFFYIRKYTDIKICFSGVKQHLAPIMWLFASAIATTIYVNSDMTMLGAMCGDFYTGIYGVSTKVYSIVKQMLAAAIVVTLPRLSNLWANKRVDEYKKTINGVFNTFVTVLFPAMVGMILLSEEVVTIIGGIEYESATMSLKILSVGLCFSIFGIFYTNTMLLPMNKERQITLIMIFSSALNVILNLVLIPAFQQNGAALTTVIAELFVMGIQIWMVRKEHLITFNLRFIIGILSGCLGIFCVVKTCQSLIANVYLETAVSVTCSVLLYTILMVLFKNPFVLNILRGLKKVMRRGA